MYKRMETMYKRAESSGESPKKGAPLRGAVG
jgi:hypothetical protein